MAKNMSENPIKAARKAKNLTQQQLADLLGCSNTTISKYEQGEIENMPRPRMKQMADILGVSPIILFGFEPEKEKPATENGSELSEKDIEIIERVLRLSDSQKEALEVLLRGIEGK